MTRKLTASEMMDAIEENSDGIAEVCRDCVVPYSIAVRWDGTIDVQGQPAGNLSGKRGAELLALKIDRSASELGEFWEVQDGPINYIIAKS